MQPSQLPFCVEIIRAVGPTVVAVVVGLFAAYIAWRQWKTANEKLRLDLFEKRFVVYKAYYDFLTNILQRAKVLPEHWEVLNANSIGEQFLFGKDILDFVKELRDLAIVIDVDGSELPTLPDDERKDTSNKLIAAHKRLREIRQQLPEKFGSYISFKNILR